MKTRSTFSALINCKCPQCHEGDLFTKPASLRIKNAVDMPEVCPVCNLNFKPESGFYWGALYVSYGLAVFLSLTLFGGMYLIWGWLVWPFLITDALMLITLAPLLMRYSRTIWVYLNFKLFKSAWRN